MKRQLSQKEIEQREMEDRDINEVIRVSRREKKRQQFTKKNESPYQEENYQWENER